MDPAQFQQLLAALSGGAGMAAAGQAAPAPAPAPAPPVAAAPTPAVPDAASLLATLAALSGAAAAAAPASAAVPAPAAAAAAAPGTAALLSALAALSGAAAAAPPPSAAAHHLLHHDTSQHQASQYASSSGSKRPYDSGTGGGGGAGGDYEYAKRAHSSDEDRFPPSKVIHVRGLPLSARAEDIESAFSRFGHVAYVSVMARHQQALVEMGSVDQATAAIESIRAHPIYLGGHRIGVSYSRSQSIDREMAQKFHPVDAPASETNNGERILLIAVQNAKYPITPEVLQAVTQPHARPLRCIIAQRDTVMALVEFDSADDAIRVRNALDGRDIYDGCCTLRIKFSKSPPLIVRSNNERSWDWTNTALPRGSDADRGGSDRYRDADRDRDRYRDAERDRDRVGSAALPPRNADRAVLMVYGVESEVFTFEVLFNIMCQYGNPIKIKILRKQGSRFAMVQYAENYQADLALQCLDKSRFLGSELHVHHSKHPYIADGAGGPDSQSETKDYSSSPLLRFSRAQVAAKNCHRPSAVLHFSNAGPEFTEHTLMGIFASRGAPVPRSVKFFTFQAGTGTPLGSRDRKTGLMLFESETAGADALALCNNVFESGYTLKLSFSGKSFWRDEDARE